MEEAKGKQNKDISLKRPKLIVNKQVFNEKRSKLNKIYGMEEANGNCKQDKDIKWKRPQLIVNEIQV